MSLYMLFIVFLLLITTTLFLVVLYNNGDEPEPLPDKSKFLMSLFRTYKTKNGSHFHVMHLPDTVDDPEGKLPRLDLKTGKTIYPEEKKEDVVDETSSIEI